VTAPHLVVRFRRAARRALRGVDHCVSEHSVSGRRNGVVNDAFHRGKKSRTDAAGHGQPGERNMIFSEEVEATSLAFEYAYVPLTFLSHASRRLDHRSTAVRAGGRFWHGSK
jgi:hypothetical protein